MDEFGHRNEINDVEQSASHPKSHEVSNDVAERNNSELEDSGKNDSGKTEKMQDSQRDTPKIENAEKQPDNSELKEPKEDSHYPSSSEIDNSKQQLPESDVKSGNDQKSKQEHTPEHNFNSEPLPEAKDDKPEDKKESLDNPQSRSNEVEKASGEKDIPSQSSKLPDSTETSANDIGKSNAKEVNDPIEIKRDENDTFAPKRTSELPDTYNEGSDNKGDVAGKTNNNDIESGDYRKPESDKPLSEPEDSEKPSLREDKNYPDDLSDDEIKQLDENTAPTELIDTTNDKDHPYVDEDGNKKTWRENQSPLVNQEDSNGKYNPDAWGQEDIPKGTKLYQITGEDGKQSPYYFDEDTANKCRDKDGRIDPNAVKNYLQIDDPNNSKNTIREYYVPEDMKNVPEGRTTENPKYGEGGGKQYYISSQDDRNSLKPVLNENPKFEKLKDEYFSDLKDKSNFPNTINDNIKNNNWEKISPELNAEKRKEFANAKNDLIDDWEKLNDTKWPTYNDDVFSNSGKCIRHKGDRYDAHHIQPLTFGGKNEPQNITPLHAHDHFDKQGVHSPNSPFGQMSQFN